MQLPLNRQLSEEEAEALQDSLKRCPEGTFEAAKAYRENGEVDKIPEIVEGIAARFLEPENRPLLKKGDDSLRIFEDLGIDSLTMVEVVMLVEETLGISIDNEELRGLRTIGDVKVFIDCKVQGIPMEKTGDTYSITQLHDMMPHQAPFLFLQEASLNGDEASGVYRISGDESFLEGHFKHRPVFPASIMLEALGQLGVFYLLAAQHESIEKAVDSEKIYFTSANGIRAQKICEPGELLKLRVKVQRIKHPIATFEGQITSDDQKVAFAEEINLAFDYSA